MMSPTKAADPETDEKEAANGPENMDVDLQR